MDTESTYSRPPKTSGLSAATLLVALVAGVLAVALIAVLVLNNQNSSDLNSARLELVAMAGTNTSLQSQLAAKQARFSQLESDLSSAKADVAQLELDFAAAQTTAQAAVVAAQADTAATEAELQAAEARVTSVQTELAAAKSNLTTIENQLATANVQIAALQAATLQITQLQAANLALSADLAKIRSPRHFNDLLELQRWLALDDTNILYASGNSIERAFTLSMRALGDGMIISATVQPAGLGSFFLKGVNYAVVGGTQVYSINPDNDELVLVHPNVSPPINLNPLP
jgi:hypothetical protein